jgi:hypothetical protein
MQWCWLKGCVTELLVMIQLHSTCLSLPALHLSCRCCCVLFPIKIEAHTLVLICCMMYVVQSMVAAEKLDAVSVHVSGISKLLRQQRQQQQQHLEAAAAAAAAADAADGGDGLAGADAAAVMLVDEQVEQAVAP